MTKKHLRTFYTERLSALPENRSDMDASIISNVAKVLKNIQSGGLVAFVPFRKEPGILPLLRQWLADGNDLFLPRYNRENSSYELVKICSLESELASGHYGILEPIPSLIGSQPPFLAPMQRVWLVPALAFDRSGNRLGRGAGYYDRLLEGADGVKIGVAYDCQIADAIPSGAHDVAMDYVVTESHIISVSSCI
ncbi:MAG: 5-formyltetrahydrofolate cyclo-ligase [Victivallales bacterium]|nr:5-formyltetrahydrofolate cyclo-ligase [Victivallales bacterium]